MPRDLHSPELRPPTNLEVALAGYEEGSPVSSTDAFPSPLELDGEVSSSADEGLSSNKWKLKECR